MFIKKGDKTTVLFEKLFTISKCEYFLVVCVYFCGVFSKVYMHIKKGEAYVREGLL